LESDSRGTDQPAGAHEERPHAGNDAIREAQTALTSGDCCS
jgi:hypothetical protein